MGRPHHAAVIQLFFGFSLKMQPLISNAATEPFWKPLGCLQELLLLLSMLSGLPQHHWVLGATFDFGVEVSVMRPRNNVSGVAPESA